MSLRSLITCRILATLIVTSGIGAGFLPTSIRAEDPPRAVAAQGETGAKKATESSTEVSSASRVPTRPKVLPTRVSAAHILVTYAGSPAAGPEVTRTREEAENRAKDILVRARDAQTAFADLVTEWSDDTRTAGNGGQLGIFEVRQLRPEFRALGDAIASMEVGQVADVVESPLGFHVLSRLEIVEYSASHILVRFKGTERAKPSIVRTKEEALARANEALEKAKAKDADFATLAKEYSDDDGSAARGGDLGIFGPGQMVPEFEKAVAKIAIDEVTGPVESPFGFHIIRRKRIERVRASHILIQYTGSERAPPEVIRSKDEAAALAKSVLADIRAGKSTLADAAKTHSNCPSSSEGGDLGTFGKGAMHPLFEAAAFGLAVDGISDVIETPFGFHIIQRTE
jgi:parvulin-like peptidyl-prolyl isomerase